MLKIDELIDQLCEVQKARGLSKVELARMTGMHANTLAHFGRPGWSPSVETLRRIERVLMPPAAVPSRLGGKSRRREEATTGHREAA